VYLSYGHPYHLNAGASIPLRGKKATHDLQGRCVDSFGKGIEGIEVQCGDLRVQTDARGNFSFKNISEEDLLELRPFSFPFGHWPTGGLQLTAADRNPVFVFHRATSLTVDLAFSTPTPGTPLPMVDPNNLQLLLTSSGNPPQNFFPDPQGIFRLSHLSAGTFTVEIKGLPGSLRSAPLTLTLNEGEVAQRTLTIEVQPQFFPVQHL
jgi:hypothetical protein